MKKTATAIAMMTLTLALISTAMGQPRKRAGQQIGNPIGLGGTVTAGVKNRPTTNFRKRIDKASPVTNRGDTGTYEVGHKGARRNGQFRSNPTSEGTTQRTNRRPGTKGWSFGASNPTIINNGTTGENSQTNRTRAPQPKFMKLGDIKGEVINSQQPNSAKYDGIDGESNDARTKKPNQRRKTQNLLPYLEQSNLKTRPQSKQFGAGNQVEAKTTGKGNQ